MRLQWLDEDHTRINALLDAGDTLGRFVGPTSVMLTEDMTPAEFNIAKTAPPAPYEPPLDSVVTMPDAHQRIDNAMAMLNDALPEPATDQPELIRRMDEQQLADYVAGLSTAIRAMATGFKGRTPRAETPPPLTPEPTHARSRTKRR